MADEQQLTKITLRLPASLVKQAKHYAVDADLDLQEVVSQALRAFLSRKGGR
jgi:hypothetical protein